MARRPFATWHLKTMAAPSIDFVSDVICPWCFIGFTRLQQALEKSGMPDAPITMRPFLLDADTPAEGADLRERLEKRYGSDPEKMFEKVEAAARASGVALDFKKIRRTPNTLKAHALLGEAMEKGTQLALAKALFDAYFLEGKDIGQDAVLRELATANGFTADEVTKIVSDRKLLLDTREEAEEIAAQGIGGVPFTIFDQRLAVSGAQSVEAFEAAIAKAIEVAATA